MWAKLKNYKKAIAAAVGGAAGVAVGAVLGGVTVDEWWAIALAAVAAGVPALAVRNGDKPSAGQITYTRDGGYR